MVTGSKFNLPAPPDTVLPPGFIFAGWLVGTPEGLTSYSVGENEQVLPSGTSYTVNADVSLTARYKGINGIATNLNQVTRNKSQVSNEGWYMMDGRKLSGKPTAKGIYMNNGHKVIIK